MLLHFPQVYYKPFKNNRMDELEQLSLYATTIMLFGGLYFLSEDVGEVRNQHRNLLTHELGDCRRQMSPMPRDAGQPHRKHDCLSTKQHMPPA